MTRSNRARAWTTAWLFVGLLFVACAPVSVPASGQPQACDDIPADMGGCSSSRPAFLGSNCAEIGAEWGDAVDQGVLAVMSGPAASEGQQRSTRISDVVVLASIVAGMRLDDLGLLPSCDAPEFLNAARPKFSTDLLNGIGAVLFDGAPAATPQDWENLLTRAIRIIDEGEQPSAARGTEAGAQSTQTRQ